MAKSNKSKGGKGTTKPTVPARRGGGKPLRESHNKDRKGAGGTIDTGPRKKPK